MDRFLDEFSALTQFTAILFFVFGICLIVNNWSGGFVDTFRAICQSLEANRIMLIVLGLVLLAFLVLAVWNNRPGH